MKLFLITCCLIPLLSWSQNNRQLTIKEMREDLRVFREIREKANSGLYIYRSRKQIDSIYKVAAKEISKPLFTTDFFKIILRLTDFEGSCHNHTELSSAHIENLNKARSFFPYSLKYIDGKIIFNNDDQKIPVGSRILSINGVDDKTLMQSFYKYMPADGFTMTEKYSGSVNKSFGTRYLIEYGLSDSFMIKYSVPGTDLPRSLSVKAVSLPEREVNLLKRHSAAVDSIIDYKVQPTHSFRMIDRNIGLLNFRVFSMASGIEDPKFGGYVRFIDSVFTKLDEMNVPNLIIDLRGNPGGSDPMFEQPMMYLTDSNFKENLQAYSIFDEIPLEKYFWGVNVSEKMDSAALVQGRKFLKDYFTHLVDGKNHQSQKHNPVYSPKKPAFRGRTFLLIDENVASAGSHLASLIRAYARNTTIVGVETCGGYYKHNGHIPVVYELPNTGIKTKFSIVHVVQDAPSKPQQPEARGIMPDIEVWQSHEDFMKKEDTQMKTVLRLIQTGNAK